MTIYADSSFIVSTCIHDMHTTEVATRLSSRPQVFVTPLNRAEVANAIRRYVFRGAISEADARASWTNFERDRVGGVWSDVAFPSSAWDASVVLSVRFAAAIGVRTLDSLHVASALELGVRKFWTFDERQARLAEAAGLDTSA